MTPKGYTDYEELKAEALENPEIRQAYDSLELADCLARLRILRGLTQEELAALVGTRQPNIARLESGKTSPTLPFLQRVAEALGGRLVVKVELPEGAQPMTHCA